MAGYCGWSMSVNAANAYEAGRKPLSAFKTADLRNVGLDISLGFAKWLAEVGYWCTHEKHHMSKRYNWVYFYDLEELRDFLEDADIAKLEKEYRCLKPGKNVQTYENCSVDWLEWGGTKNWPTCKEKHVEGVRVEVKGKTATVTFQDGKTMKKRLFTKGFKFEILDNITHIS